MTSQLKIGKRNTFQISMEEDEVNTEVVVTDPPEGYEENENEVVDAANELDQNTSDLDAGLDEMEELGVVKDQAVKAVEEGDGFTEREAEMAEVSLEHLYERLGYNKPTRRPSLEDYGSKNTRLETTKKFVLSLEEDESNLWEKFKAFCEKISSKIADLWKSLTDSLVKTEKWANDLSASIDKMGDTREPRSKEFRDNRISIPFIYYGRDINASNVIKQLTYQEQATKVVFSGFRSLLAESFKVIEDEAFNTINSEGNPEAYKENVKKVLEKGLSSMSGVVKKNGNVFVAGPFVDNKSIIFTTGVLGKLGAEWREFTKGEKMDEKAEPNRGKVLIDPVPVLSVSEMKSVIDKVKELCNVTRNAKKELDVIVKEIKDVNVKLASLSKQTKEPGKFLAKKNKVISETRSDLTTNINAFNKIATGIPSLNLQGMTAGLHYVKCSLARYKDEATARSE